MARSVKVAAILLFVLSGIFFASATMTVLRGRGVPEDPNQFLPYAVGAYLVPMVTLIIGVSLWNRASAAEKKAKEVIDAELVEKPGQNPFADRQ